MIPEDKVISFAGSLFKSVWALELLLVLKRDPERVWRAEELILELRSSQVVVAEALNNLLVAGIAVEQEPTRYRYHAATPDIDEMIGSVADMYRTKPTAIVREIVTTPNRQLKLLSDAFRFKE